jgi:iron complex transport system substrate-binding protein
MLGLSACSGPTEAEAEKAGSPDFADVTLTNCGVEVTVDRPPKRVFTIKSSTLELMLALGLEETVIGSAYLDGPVPEKLAPEGWEPNVVAEQIPSREIFLGTEPDFVLAGWESSVSADGIGEREELEELGIKSYVLPPACEFGDEVEQSVDFGDIFTMIEEVGGIFDAEAAAEEIIAEQQAQLDAIEPLKEVTDVLWYSSGDDTPFVAGAAGTPQMIMEAAGVTNVFEDVARTWFSIPWEGFVSEDPDFIVLVDAPWNSAEDKRERLESHPAASQLEAVQDKQYIEIPFATTEAGVRNIDAVELLANAVTEAQAEQ